MHASDGWTFTKRNVEQYQFNGPHGMWAIITLDPRGIFQAVSDVGDYAYDGWGHHGRESFKHFLLELRDPDYFLGKVMRGRREFDYDASLREMRRRVVEKRREGDLDGEAARACWDEIDALGGDHTSDRTYFIAEQVMNCEALAEHIFRHDPCEVPTCERWSAWGLRFFHEVFRGRLVPTLRAEIGIVPPSSVDAEPASVAGSDEGSGT